MPPILTRRTFLSNAMLTLGAAACSRPTTNNSETAAARTDGPGSSVSAARQLKLTALHVPALCGVGLRIARLRGFFSDEGLDVVLLPGDVSRQHEHTASWVTSPDGPVRADITTLEYPALAPIADGTLDYYVVAGEHSGCRQLIVPNESSIQSVADLKGRRVALPPFNDRVMWDYLVRQAGAAPESVSWVPVTVEGGGPEEVAFIKEMFAKQSLDAYIASDPSGEILKNEGVARLLASNTWTAPLSSWYCCLVGMRREIVDRNPWAVRAVVRAYRRSAEFIERNPAEAIDISIKAGFMPPETNREVGAKLLGEYVWTATSRVEADLERYFKLLAEAGRLPPAVSPADLVKRVYRGGEA